MDYSKIRREYIHVPLSEATMDKNPMVVFQKWFDEAFELFGLDTNAMSLSTVDQHGRPSLRIVLLKGVTEQGFLFFTDYDSRKGKELQQNPSVAVLFYWPGMDRQIRIEGRVQKVSSAVSDSYFYSRPVGSQLSAVASPQSAKITMEELQKRREVVEKEDSVSRPEHWGGFEIVAHYFEFWSGRENRFHDRIVYEKRKGNHYDRYRIAP